MRRNKWMRRIAMTLAVVMTVGSVSMAIPQNTSAKATTSQDKINEVVQKVASPQRKDIKMPKSGYDVPSGTELDMNILGAVKGTVKPGEHVYTIPFEVKGTKILHIMPRIRYKQQDLKVRTVLTLQKDEEPQTLYVSRSEAYPFEKESMVRKELNLFSDNNGWGYACMKILDKGSYTLQFSLPEEVTEGADVYVQFMDEKKILDTVLSLIGGIKEDKANTQKEAYEIKPESDETTGLRYFMQNQKDEDVTRWYKFTLPRKREVVLLSQSTLYGTKRGMQLSLYDANGKTLKTYNGATIPELDTDDEPYGVSNVHSYSETLKAGTYYVELKSKEQADGFTLVDIMPMGPNEPDVTYWANGKGLIKGKVEEGAKVYAKIDGYVYRSAKVDSTKKFTIKIPKLSAGKKIVVYQRDITNVKSEETEVIIQKIPKAPTLTSYKKGNTAIKGTTIKKGRVVVTYQGKKYFATATSKGYFTVKTKKLVSGQKIRVTVTDRSGNVSKPNYYKVK